MRTAKQRFDSVRVKAHFDDNGFLVDRPIVARIGLQIYKTPFGERREFRPASEVFKPDSLSTFAGKPITLGHVTVTPENAESVVVGSCSGAGVPNGIGVEAPLSIYSQRAIDSAKKRDAAELSVGYTSVDIDKPGWGNNATGEYFFLEDMPEGWKADSADWVEFDALQTDIKVNHIALVFRGRAGIAKLNLDSEQEFPYDEKTDSQQEEVVMTVKIKIDSAEVEVTKDVAAHIEKLNAEIATAQGKADGLEAERDALQAKVDGIPAEIEKAVDKAKADAKELTDLVAVAGEAGVKTDGLDAKAIKVAYVKEVTGADVSEKSDAYIEAAFDLAKDSDKMAAQRIATKGDATKEKQDGEAKALDPNARFSKL